MTPNTSMTHDHKEPSIQNTALLFIVLAPIAIIFYALYVFNPSNHGTLWLYILQVIADCIAIMTMSTLWITILLDIIQSGTKSKQLRYSDLWLDQHRPTADIFITVFNEPLHIVKKTIAAALKQTYPVSVYVLDDGESAELELYCKIHGIFYASRPLYERKHAKAGNINFGLLHARSPFFAVLDADQVPKPIFIEELLPYFCDNRVALVQSPQHFMNTHSFNALGTAQAQEIFYRYVQPAKNSFNASFCVGTNMIFRRSAIEAIGGVYPIDHSEDIWTTIQLHKQGYQSVFHRTILAEGRAPETIQAYFRQQSRWARGGFEMFFYHNPLFIKELSIDQRIQYLFSNFHYFSGFAVLIYLLLPLLYLLFGIHPMNIQSGPAWFLHYLPYFSVVYFLPVFLLGSLEIATLSTSLATFAPYVGACLSVLFGAKFQWVSTGSNKSSAIMTNIWPHLFLVSLSIVAIPIGWYNPLDSITTTISSVWTAIHTYLLLRFIRHGTNGNQQI